MRLPPILSLFDGGPTVIPEFPPGHVRSQDQFRGFSELFVRPPLQGELHARRTDATAAFGRGGRWLPAPHPLAHPVGAIDNGERTMNVLGVTSPLSLRRRVRGRRKAASAFM